MNSEFLTMIGLGGIDIGYILVGITAVLLILLIMLIVLIVKYTKVKKRYDRFMKGKNGAGEIALELRALADLPENQSSILSIYMALIYNSNSRRSKDLFWPSFMLGTHVVHRYIYAGKHLDTYKY